MPQTQSVAESNRRLGLVAQVTHLMCHIFPRIGGTWKDSIEGIRQRLQLFDGRRVFGIVHGDNLEPPETVQRELADIATDFVVMANEPSLREVQTWPSMISILHGQPGRVFYCHSKGGTHHAESVCQEWRRVMLEVCLDYPALIDAALERYAVCGPFRRHEGLGVPFHFSGSFYWFNCAALWARSWGAIEQVWYGVESWPARQFTLAESFCLFLDSAGDLYSERYWEVAVRPALKAWKDRITKCTR